MSERILSPVSYVGVFAVLVVLTCVTVGISFLSLPLVWHVALCLIIGAIKATLVVLIFMHVLYSSRLAWLVIVVSVFWLMIVLVPLTLADYFSRGMLPHTPGH